MLAQEQATTTSNRPRTRLRVLCLHGHSHAGAVLAKAITVLRESLKDHVDFVYVTAPHYVMGFEPAKDDPTRQRAVLALPNGFTPHTLPGCTIYPNFMSCDHGPRTRGVHDADVHILDRHGTVVPATRSAQLVRAFTNPVVNMYDKGHEVPHAQAALDAVHRFLDAIVPVEGVVAAPSGAQDAVGAPLVARL
ncbi:hypothetical protein GGF31_001514 [Allomyces arbusculus]|nr:hypothetical protein GGF31_001514 [Allomyces arbusculus]